MEKLDKVIRALEECYYGKCTRCPYVFSGDMSCSDAMNRDALEVIRALVDDLRGAQDEIHRLMRGRSEESMCATCEYNLEAIRKYHIAYLPDTCPRRCDLIGRRALLNEVNRLCGGWYHRYDDAIADVLKEIGDAPAVEAEPVVHAHWNGDWCSRCDEVSEGNYPRCPYCGAHMDEEVSE